MTGILPGKNTKIKKRTTADDGPRLSCSRERNRNKFFRGDRTKISLFGEKINFPVIGTTCKGAGCAPKKKSNI
jgi:hypothetical protein